jgi:hypothetical protein
VRAHEAVTRWGPWIYGIGFWLYLVGAIGQTHDWMRTVASAFLWPAIVLVLLLMKMF